MWEVPILYVGLVSFKIKACIIISLKIIKLEVSGTDYTIMQQKVTLIKEHGLYSYTNKPIYKACCVVVLRTNGYYHSCSIKV